MQKRSRTRGRRLTGIALLLACLGLTGACGPVLLPEDARVREVIGLQHARVWSAGDVALVDELYTEDFVGHFPGATRIEGRDALKTFILEHREAFPDWRESVQMLIVEGDRAASRFVSTGTHEGEFMGVPASGRSVRLDEAAWFRMRDGRIAEQWAFVDVSSMAQQLSGSTALTTPDPLSFHGAPESAPNALLPPPEAAAAEKESISL